MVQALFTRKILRCPSQGMHIWFVVIVQCWQCQSTTVLTIPYCRLFGLGSIRVVWNFAGFGCVSILRLCHIERKHLKLRLPKLLFEKQDRILAIYSLLTKYWICGSYLVVLVVGLQVLWTLFLTFCSSQMILEAQVKLDPVHHLQSESDHLFLRSRLKSGRPLGPISCPIAETWFQATCDNQKSELLLTENGVLNKRIC